MSFQPRVFSVCVRRYLEHNFIMFSLIGFHTSFEFGGTRHNSHAIIVLCYDVVLLCGRLLSDQCRVEALSFSGVSPDLGHLHHDVRLADRILQSRGPEIRQISDVLMAFPGLVMYTRASWSPTILPIWTLKHRFPWEPIHILLRISANAETSHWNKNHPLPPPSPYNPPCPTD